MKQHFTSIIIKYKKATWQRKSLCLYLERRCRGMHVHKTIRQHFGHTDVSHSGNRCCCSVKGIGAVKPPLCVLLYQEGEPQSLMGPGLFNLKRRFYWYQCKSVAFTRAEAEEQIVKDLFSWCAKKINGPDCICNCEFKVKQSDTFVKDIFSLKQASVGCFCFSAVAAGGCRVCIFRSAHLKGSCVITLRGLSQFTGKEMHTNVDRFEECIVSTL